MRLDSRPRTRRGKGVGADILPIFTGDSTAACQAWEILGFFSQTGAGVVNIVHVRRDGMEPVCCCLTVSGSGYTVQCIRRGRGATAHCVRVRPAGGFALLVRAAHGTMTQSWDEADRHEWPQDLHRRADELSDEPVESADSDSAADFLEPSRSEPERVRARRPGPGLLEAVVWAVGVLIAQGIGYAVVALIEGGDPNLAAMATANPSRFVAMLGIMQLVFVLCAIFAAALRFRGALFRNIPLTPLRIRHAVIIGLMVFPLAFTSSKLAEVFRESWNEAAERFPRLEKLEPIEAIELLSQVAGEASFLMLLLVIAVAPAIGEEVVFRGVIGRGLTARWGLAAGVLMTSVLFAIVHGDVVHAVGVVPLGIMMHVSYLATRSFWAPVLFHFANNALATTGLKVAALAGAAEQAAVEPPDLPFWVYLAAGVCVVMLATLLWRTRVRFRLPDGSVWNPGYSAVERPPADVPAVPHCEPASLWLIGAAGLSLVAFGASFVAAVVQAALNA